MDQLTKITNAYVKFAPIGNEKNKYYFKQKRTFPACVAK